MTLPLRFLPPDWTLSILSWGAVLLLLSMATCVSEVDPLACRPAAAGSCPSGWLVYLDSACSSPDINSGPSCRSMGDGLCYKLCDTDADCRAAGLRVCGSITLFQGGDAGHYVGVCNGTAQLPACTADSGADTSGGQ